MRVDSYIYVHFGVFVPKCAEINRDEPRCTEMCRNQKKTNCIKRAYCIFFKKISIPISVHLGSSRFISVHSELSLLPRKSEIWRFLGSSRLISVHSRFILEMNREWTEMNRDEPRFFKKNGNRLVLYNLSFFIYIFDKRLCFNKYIQYTLSEVRNNEIKNSGFRKGQKQHQHIYKYSLGPLPAPSPLRPPASTRIRKTV